MKKWEKKKNELAKKAKVGMEMHSKHEGKVGHEIHKK